MTLMSAETCVPGTACSVQLPLEALHELPLKALDELPSEALCELPLTALESVAQGVHLYLAGEAAREAYKSLLCLARREREAGQHRVQDERAGALQFLTHANSCQAPPQRQT